MKQLAAYERNIHQGFDLERYFKWNYFDSQAFEI